MGQYGCSCVDETVHLARCQTKRTVFGCLCNSKAAPDCVWAIS